MSIRRFLQSFVLTLSIPFLIYAADTRELSRKTSDPFKSGKFILKSDDETLAPARTDGPEAKERAETKVEAKAEPARPVVLYAERRQVDLNVAQSPLFSASLKGMSLIDRTYLDAYTILQENNSCSRFFGGPRLATEVLNSLHPKLKKSAMGDSLAGIGMFGAISYVTDFETGYSYRLFEKALVNQGGPFYQSVNYSSKGYYRKIGYFQANTREARVSMLLHELGHLMPGTDGRWLLPDDGDSEAQSVANTQTIMNRCGEQIKSLSLSRAETPRLEASTRTLSEPRPTVQENATSDAQRSN